jgi:hypothetical protein
LPGELTKELPVKITQALPFSTLLLAFIVSMIPGSVAVYAVFNLRKLFGLYEDGVIFSEENVRCFRNLGYALVIWVASILIFRPLSSIVLTLNNTVGERQLVIGIGSSDLTTLLTGLVVVLISWVMNEASKLEDEQAHTV